MSKGYFILDDRRDEEIIKLTSKRVNVALKAEMKRNGGDLKAAIQVLKKTFDFNAAEKAAEEEYDAKYTY